MLELLEMERSFIPEKVGTIFREKTQVNQVSDGQECGITVKDYMDSKKMTQ